MASIFEPADPIAPFIPPAVEYQVNINPTSELEDYVSTDEPVEDQSRSFRWPLLAYAGILLILVGRLVNLQITQNAFFQVLAQGNRIESRTTQAPRGLILDHTGKSLVANTPLYNLELYPAQLPRKKADREEIYRQIEAVTAIKAADIAVEVDKQGLRSLEPLALKSNLDRDTALLWNIKLSSLSGVTVNHFPNRQYQAGDGLAHLLGYTGRVTKENLEKEPGLARNGYIGKAGLESSYDQELQGTPGRDEVEVDSKGQIQRTVASQPATPGNTLKLNLDRELQAVMAKALSAGIERANRKKGVAIAINPQNGGILGMVSLPDYDNNAFSQPDRKDDRQNYLTNPDQPLFNRAIAGSYAPGSTVKPIWAAAGLEEGIINAKTDIETPAEIRIGQQVFPDWKFHGHADVKKAIAESNNIFFYAVAGGYDKIKGLGPNKMHEYGARFGWNAPTGIDLPGEGKGLLPDPDWKKRIMKEPWYIGDTYHSGIGQGFLGITPLQLVNAISTIANGGTLYKPQMVREVVAVDGATVAMIKPEVIRKDVISAANLQIVREGMRQTVLEGTARPLNELKIPVAGKTGTAQFGGEENTHAWFTGFAPYDNPKIAIVVMVEGGGESFEVAVPIAKEILSWYSEHDQEVSQD